MSYRATPHTAIGVSPSQLMMGREIRTLLPTLESNLKPISVSYEAIAERDEKSKTAYQQSFDKRRGVRKLSELQPGDAVHMRLDQKKGWKTPGVVIAKSSTPRSYVIETPQSIVRRNRRNLRPTLLQLRSSPTLNQKWNQNRILVLSLQLLVCKSYLQL